MATTNAELIDGEFKRDEKGRRITPAPRRAELVEAYRTSGLTMTQFAKQEGIKATTLAKWAMRHGGKRAKGRVHFEEVKLGLPSGWAYEISLPSGMTVRAASAASLVELLSLIRQ